MTTQTLIAGLLATTWMAHAEPAEPNKPAAPAPSAGSITINGGACLAPGAGQAAPGAAAQSQGKPFVISGQAVMPSDPNGKTETFNREQALKSARDAGLSEERIKELEKQLPVTEDKTGGIQLQVEGKAEGQACQLKVIEAQVPADPDLVLPPFDREKFVETVTMLMRADGLPEARIKEFQQKLSVSKGGGFITLSAGGGTMVGPDGKATDIPQPRKGHAFHVGPDGKLTEVPMKELGLPEDAGEEQIAPAKP